MELSTAVAPLDAYEAHCVDQMNETYERYLFNRRQQEASLRQRRSTLSWVTCDASSRRVATAPPKNPSFIRDRIVIGVRDDATRKKLLQTRTLATAIATCREAETATRQLKAMTSRRMSCRHCRSSRDRPVAVGARSHVRATMTTDRRAPTDEVRDAAASTVTVTHASSRNACPALGQMCSKCGKMNQFAAVYVSFKATERHLRLANRKVAAVAAQRRRQGLVCDAARRRQDEFPSGHRINSECTSGATTDVTTG